MVNCIKCGRELGKLEASISGSQFGDENTDSYFWCPDCEVYTLEHYFDDFDGEESSSAEGPVSKDKGDEAIRLIRECPEPWDKKCRCPAHLKYWAGNLD